MEHDIRAIAAEEFEPWIEVFGLTFGFDPHPDDREVWRERTELDRTMGVFDGERLVATGGAHSYRVTVPGGSKVDAAGVTAISVAPSHRRRGILTAMMRHQLEDVRDRGEPIAVLWASESQIYGRFGYGVAIEGADLSISRSHARLRSGHPPIEDRVRIVTDPDEARELVPPLYERASVGIPGTIDRTPADWSDYFHDPERRRQGSTALRFAVAERDGEPVGYARYRQKLTWTDMHPDATLKVGDVAAVDGGAYTALWSFLLGIDLVATIDVATARVDEPVVELLEQPRRVRRTLGDTIWLRLVDVAAALAARRYAVDGALVIEVVDDFLPGSGGTFRLAGGPGGASCERTDAPADLRIATADLAGAYLGSSRLSDLHWLGRMEGDADAAGLAHRMFSWPEPPRCSVHF
jgi:predicted acetyltransferase